jgi:hypothetical protein
MADKLALWNAALQEIGAPRLGSLTETAKARYELDNCYANVVADCLRAGSWNFALRTSYFDHDASVTPAFGYSYVFAKPSDWVRTVMMGSDEMFRPPLTDYLDEKGTWLANVDPLYVQYVSNDAAYGMDLTKWPDAFRRYVEVALAERIVLAITQNAGDKQRLEERTLPRAKRNALNDDAVNEATKFLPASSWTRARGAMSSINGTGRGL